MGLKILAVGAILLGINLMGATLIPALVVGLLLVIGGIGVLAGYEFRRENETLDTKNIL